MNIDKAKLVNDPTFANPTDETDIEDYDDQIQVTIGKQSKSKGKKY